MMGSVYMYGEEDAHLYFPAADICPPAPYNAELDLTFQSLYGARGLHGDASRDHR